MSLADEIAKGVKVTEPKAAEPEKGQPITIVKAIAWSSFPAELVSVDGGMINYRLPGSKTVRSLPLGVATYRPRSTGSKDGL